MEFGCNFFFEKKIYILLQFDWMDGWIHDNDDDNLLKIITQIVAGK